MISRAAKVLGVVAVCACAAASQDFPDWRSPATIEATTWRTSAPDTADHLEGSWYVVVDVPDLLRKDTGLVWLNVRMHPVLSWVMQPVEWGASALGDFVFEPLRAPVLYVERSDVIDRAVALLRIDSAGEVMAYPTLVMDGAADSRLGATISSSNLLGTGWYGRLAGSLMVNRDWYSGANLTSPSWSDLGLRVTSRVAASYSQEMAIWVPSQYSLGGQSTPITVALRRQLASLGIAIPMGDLGGLEPSWAGTLRQVYSPVRRTGFEETWRDLPWFEEGDRGVRGTEFVQEFALNWHRGDRDHEGVPSEGGSRSVNIDRSFSRGGGDAFTLAMEATQFYLLGDEKYVYRREDVLPYIDFSPRVIVDMLDLGTLRRRLTQRRILAFKVRAERMWEVDPARPVSFFQFPTMGGEAPGRAYGGGRLMGRSVIGGTAEYRWPIWKYVDGSMFAELAWAAPEWWQPGLADVAPGVGLGVRVRTLDQFFFRLQGAYGRAGLRAMATVSPEF